MHYLRTSPKLAGQNQPDTANGDGANCARPTDDQYVDQHLCRDYHQERQDGAEQNESRDNRSERVVPDGVDRFAEVHFGGLLTRAARQDEFRAGNRLIGSAVFADLDKSGQMLDNGVERVRP
jgi:hypothetical protein